MTDVAGVTVTAQNFIQQMNSLMGGGIPGWTLPGTTGAAIANVQAMLANGTPGTIGVPPTPAQRESLFITFMAGLGAAGGEALAGVPGAIGGAVLGTAIGFGMENYGSLPLSVQLGVNPYAPQ